MTYAYGPVTVGYQTAESDVSGSVTSDADSVAYSASYAVNDDLSISYAELESTKKITGSPKNTMEAESIQIAYTMGGASIKLADTEVTNGTYSTAASADKDGMTLALSLAF